MEQYRDFSKFKKCAKCELLAYCRGCPAVAGSQEGDFYAADPYGQEILHKWQIRPDYYAVMQLLLGYPREGDINISNFNNIRMILFSRFLILSV